MRTHAMCGRRLFIKRRRVREAATADCQQMAAITYQWLPQVYAPIAAPPPPPLSAPARTAHNRHLNCHGRQTRHEPEQRLVAVAVEEEEEEEEEGGAKKEAQTIRRILVFCSRFAGHIKNIFNLTAANVFTPCCHMLNGQAG